MTRFWGRRLLRPTACVLAICLGAGPEGGPRSALAQEAASAVQDVTLQDVALTLGETVLRAPRVTVSGTRLSKDDLIALLRGSGPTAAARLARLDAASLNIPELRAENAGPGGTRQVILYRDVVAKDVRAGRIAELVGAGATITVEGGPRTGTGTYGRIQATDLDLTALARLYGEPGDGKGAVQRVYGTFAIAEVAYVDEGGTAVKLARLEGKDFGGRQIPSSWTGAMQAFSGVDLEKAPPAERARVTGLAADLFEAVSVGTLEATGLSVQETKGDAPFDLGIARMSYTGSGASLEEVAFSGAGARTRIGRLSLTDFSLGPTIAALRKFSAAVANPSQDDLRRLTPALGTLALQDMSIDLPAEQPVKGRPPEPAAHLGVRSASMTFGPPRDGVPTASRLSLSGLTLPASTVAGVPGLGSLGLYGYRDLDLNLVADTSWDEGTRELSVREISLSGKDMGSLRLNGTVGGIGPEVFDPNAAVSGYAMLSATAKALDLTIENGGLFERFIAAQSKVLSLKPEELTQEYVTATAFGVPAILGNSAAAKAIGTAMAQFVAKPGRLSLSARPKNGNGLGVIDFSAAPTPGAVLDRLEINAKAN
ncbi:hypothetical protein [Methylobacterium iners]|uniref:AsmA-like C-terminal domain-containing protein n=1 Tax=Methylobacterium iners TaxID=418707 RepID=A0ABQ4RTR3_9HYPH|nr:hypothetical protein [Methylobacterium iners]GJD93063.1 hypothetical protein OCOJLMKI_0249 [Methylobacterium iners]